MRVIRGEETNSFIRRGGYIPTAVVPIAWLLSFILLGHFGLFLGHSFFVDEDAVRLYSYAETNARSNGWIPGEGLGDTHFYGDPGVHHVWSPFSLWHHLFSNPVLAYNTSIIILLLALSLAQFALIRRVAPAMGLFPSLLLATLVVFGSLRYEFFFQRHWIMLAVGAPLVALTLYDFHFRPAPLHYFKYTATLFAALVLGSTMSFLELLAFGALFYVCLVYYHRHHVREGRGWAPSIRSFLLLNAGALLTVLALSAWEGYSIIYEHLTVGYVRDSNYAVPDFFAWPSFRDLVFWFSGYFHAGLLSWWAMTPGLDQIVPTISWNNVSPFFPVVLLLLLAQRSLGFWEFFCKTAVVLFYLYEGLLLFFPGILNPVQQWLDLYPLEKFHPVYQLFQVALFAVLLERARAGTLVRSPWRLRPARILSVLLVVAYGGLLVFSVLVGVVNGIDHNVWPTLLDAGRAPSIPGTFLTLPAKELVLSVLDQNIKLFTEVSAFHMLFYGGTFLGMTLFAFGRWEGLAAGGHEWIMPALFAAVNVLLAWSVYPLNKEPLVWDAQTVDGRKVVEIFSPTYRIARVKPISCRQQVDKIACYRERLFAAEDEPRRYRAGYTLVPAMDLTAVKSVTQKDVAAFVFGLLQAEGVKIPSLRWLESQPPLFQSRLFDIAAIRYLFSEFELDQPESLSLVYKGRQFYLYENRNAWPYFYLADRVIEVQGYQDILEMKKGEAFVWGANEPEDHSRWQNLNKAEGGAVRLTRFTQGEMEFSYSQENERFLVVSDAWHPRWKAEVDGVATGIFKANGVFKGVLLPAGSHTLRMYFDASPYRSGIFISIVSAAIFLSGLVYVRMRRRGEIADDAGHSAIKAVIADAASFER